MTTVSGNVLDGQVAVITGGASGIGRRSAELLVEHGAKVVLGDRDESALADCLEALGKEVCETVTVDVTVEEQVAGLVAAAVDRFGRVDIGVNSAGVGTMSPIPDHPADSWRTVIDICLTGVFLAVKYESRQMLAQGAGAIVNIASINGRQPAEGMVAYCSAKAGVEMLTKVAGLELGPRGVRVNAIAPGFVETPMTAPTRGPVRDRFVGSIPLGRPGRPEDIGQAVLFLAGPHSPWVNGETLVVDGGEVYREYPRLLSGF
ncbi:MAG: SDR family NAD(P)-dependent oxidoreductase [Actinomycetota bacterium]|nr:SDR family NAD(P)-dependent oxidoreductase [Actinomycetota bacterium]